jgi:hypothetical protein
MVPNWVPQELDGLQLHMTKFVAFEDFISYPHQDAKQAHYGSHLFTKLIVFFVLKLVRTLFDHDEIWVCLNIGDPKKPMVCHHSTHVLFWVYQSVPPLTQPSAGIDTVRHGWISILMKNCLPIVLSLKSHVPRIGLRMFKGKLQENSIFGSSNPTFLDSSRFLPSSTVIY